MNGFELRGIYPQRASAAHSRSEHCRRRAEKKPLAGPMDSLAAGRPWHPAVGGPVLSMTSWPARRRRRRAPFLRRSRRAFCLQGRACTSISFMCSLKRKHKALCGLSRRVGAERKALAAPARPRPPPIGKLFCVAKWYVLHAGPLSLRFGKVNAAFHMKGDVCKHRKTHSVCQVDVLPLPQAAQQSAECGEPCRRDSQLSYGMLRETAAHLRFLWR